MSVASLCFQCSVVRADFVGGRVLLETPMIITVGATPNQRDLEIGKRRRRTSRDQERGPSTS